MLNPFSPTVCNCVDANWQAYAVFDEACKTVGLIPEFASQFCHWPGIHVCSRLPFVPHRDWQVPFSADPGQHAGLLAQKSWM